MATVQPIRPAPYAGPVAAVHAGFWIRVLAYVIDAIAIGVVASMLSAFQYNSSSYGSTSSGLGTVLSFLYFTLLWTFWNGQTLGMKLFRLRVRRDTGQPMSYGIAALRWLGMLVSFVVLCIGVIWVAFDPQKQGWHDHIAGTVVDYV